MDPHQLTGYSQMKLHLLAGMPGSGKSTTAQQLRGKNQRVFVISSDEIRLAINSGRYPNGDAYVLIDPVVWKLARLAVKELLDIGCEVILDATNLTIDERASWIDLAKSSDPSTAIICYWHAADYDSPERWLRERDIAGEEYAAIRQKLEQRIQVPTTQEGFLLKEVG